MVPINISLFLKRSVVQLLFAWILAGPVYAETPPAVKISFSKSTNGVTITFSDYLFSSRGVGRQWERVTNATSPYTVPQHEQQLFFRAQRPVSILAFSSVLEMSVTGPFQQHFNLAFAGMPDGIFPPVREKPYFPATVTLGEMERPVEMRVRGNSSLQECPFPKMKLKINAANREATPFFDAREVKIGTHCAEGGEGQIGRLRDERTAFREASVYEAMRVLDFVTPRLRRLRITYRDRSPTNTAGERGWTVQREGMILEDQEVLAARLGGRALQDDEITALTNANFSAQLITDLKFFHVLAGNWDYALSTDGRNLWNTDVIQLTNKTYLPVAGDFDLASWVTADVRLNAPWDYRPDLPNLDREMHHQLNLIKQQVPLTLFHSASNRFAQVQGALRSNLQSSAMDAAGRSNALAHVTAFYTALTNIGSAKANPPR